MLIDVLDVRRLLILREVARRGSLSAAARSLGWTQPAVSQHLRALEREVGMPLLIRDGRTSSLTDAALTLVRHADAVAARMHAAEQEIAELRQLKGGRVRIAAFPSASATILPRALAAMAERHPNVEVRLLEVEPPEAIAAVLQGDADLAVVFSYAENVADAGLERIQLLEEPVLAVLTPGLRKPRALTDLASSRWIAGCERCRAHLLDVARTSGFTPEIHFETDDYVVTQELVAAGLGVALLPRLALQAVRHPKLRTCQLEEVGRRKVEVVLRSGMGEVPAVQLAIECFSQAANHYST